MTSGSLFKLLPEIHRFRDIEAGGPLGALMGVLETQAQAIHANIGLLYDSWFIETCPDWVVPYIADLVGVDPDLAGLDVPGLRGLVGNAIRYQRGRGTLATLEQAAAAVTGWPCRSVDLAERETGTHRIGGAEAPLGGAMRLGGPGWRPEAIATAARSLDLGGGGGGARTRLAAQAPGPQPATVAIQLWRIRSHLLEWAEPKRLEAGRFAIHPMGIDAPLFLPSATRPQPLSRALLAAALGGDGDVPVTLRIRSAGGWSEVPRGRMMAADLGGWAAPPLAGSEAPDGGLLAALDPELGRLAVGHGVEAVAIDHAYGAAGTLGGGTYGRAGRLAFPDAGTWTAHVCRWRATATPPGGVRVFATLAEALEHWPADSAEALIEIADNGIHHLPGGTHALDGGGRRLAIQAMDGFRPCIVGDLTLSAPRDATGGGVALLFLSGLWWAGSLRLHGAAEVHLLDCTVRAVDAAAVEAAEAGRFALLADRCVLGRLRLPDRAATLEVRGSIVDGDGAVALAGSGRSGLGPPPVLTGTTVLGRIAAAGAPVLTDSLVTGGVSTPLGLLPPPAMPSFRSRRFGSPFYALLAEDCPDVIARGATDGDELGAYHGWRRAARLKGLARVVEEYLPEGRSCIIQFMT